MKVGVDFDADCLEGLVAGVGTCFFALGFAHVFVDVGECVGVVLADLEGESGVVGFDVFGFAAGGVGDVLVEVCGDLGSGDGVDDEAFVWIAAHGCLLVCFSKLPHLVTGGAVALTAGHAMVWVMASICSVVMFSHLAMRRSIAWALSLCPGLSGSGLARQYRRVHGCGSWYASYKPYALYWLPLQKKTAIFHKSVTRRPMVFMVVSWFLLGAYKLVSRDRMLLTGVLGEGVA